MDKVIGIFQGFSGGFAVVVYEDRRYLVHYSELPGALIKGALIEFKPTGQPSLPNKGEEDGPTFTHRAKTDNRGITLTLISKQ